jgi:hypothetical protein
MKEDAQAGGCAIGGELPPPPQPRGFRLGAATVWLLELSEIGDSSKSWGIFNASGA